MCSHSSKRGGGHHRRWHVYPERGWIQFLILRSLYEKPSYGYQLMERFEQITFGRHKLETGSIYTLLRRMEGRGLLESEWVRTEGSPDRRMYKVTTRGAEALENGLKSIIKRKAMMDDLVEFYNKHFKTSEGGEKTDV